MDTKTLIGPFKQLVTMRGLPHKGPLTDPQLEIIEDAGMVVREGYILQIGKFSELYPLIKNGHYLLDIINEPVVAFPGFIDAHTHICWAGSRANDYAMRVSGKSYLEIASSGGGIIDTVKKTRQASHENLLASLKKRADQQFISGITTSEVKSGYGLTVEDEIKMLEVIRLADSSLAIDLIPTCLAAHIKPKDFSGTKAEYLEHIINNLFPILKEKKLTNRIDIFVEESAFSIEEAKIYLKEARQQNFDIVVHADQFTTGGSKLAVDYKAISADHLEASSDKEIQMLAKSDVIPLVLPGSSIGLGYQFAPARKLLNAGASLAIASDWNPGSAPMGDLLVQAAILGIYEKLTLAETFAGITYRAAAALGLNDRGIIETGYSADIAAFPIENYQDILYYQGRIKPSAIWKKGIRTTI
ncbi:MAG: imidazolonepropionase [Bacteroidales bacterium]|nr:imidazolonepropionase [Bacteroidales bacterium]